MDKNYFRYAFLSGGRSCLCLKDPEKLIKIYSWEADWQLSIFPLSTILCITCMAPLLWSPQVGYLFPCSPRKNYIVPLRPQNKILIFYVLCSPKLPVFTPVFRSLFPWSSEKMHLFICSRKPWENLISPHTPLGNGTSYLSVCHPYYPPHPQPLRHSRTGTAWVGISNIPPLPPPPPPTHTHHTHKYVLHNFICIQRRLRSACA